jgi:predicted ATPase
VVVLLTRVDIENFRSIYKASVPLSPFTLLVGANGTGKSNFLKLLRMISTAPDESKRTGVTYGSFLSEKHYSHLKSPQEIKIFCGEDGTHVYKIEEGKTSHKVPAELSDVKIFSLDPQTSGKAESLEGKPSIAEDGEGIIRVLDSLKTGDREDLFGKIEATLKSYIPEIEKLSFVPGKNVKSLQVREKHIPNPVLMKDLSEGTQLMLLLITLLYQENQPSLICIEDIDRSLHPRLFQRVIELCFELSSRKNGVQIIATTHNPYLVDEFKDSESAVLIVEKQNGETSFTPLSERIENLGSEEELSEALGSLGALGALWYSGFVGGVPQRV